MPKIEENHFVIITLAKAMTLDTKNVITETDVIIKATAMAGRWLRDQFKTSDAPPIGFAATRAYAGEIPFEIGSLIDPDAPISRGDGKDRQFILYSTGNREPLILDVRESNVIGEAPARY